jgi:outer membrane protein assembly factor BamD (BamD/ComL family)
MVQELEDKLARKKVMTGKLYMKMGDYDPALLYFRYVRDNFPATDWAIQAFYYTGEALEHLKKYDEALETYKNFFLGFSDHELADKAKKKIEDLRNKIESNES